MSANVVRRILRVHDPAVVGHAGGGVFSLAIYFWAVRVALPTDRIERLIRHGATVADEPARSRS